MMLFCRIVVRENPEKDPELVPSSSSSKVLSDDAILSNRCSRKPRERPRACAFFFVTGSPFLFTTANPDLGLPLSNPDLGLPLSNPDPSTTQESGIRFCSTNSESCRRQLQNRRTSREPLNRSPLMRGRHRTAPVRIPITLLTQNQIIRHTPDTEPNYPSRTEPQPAQNAVIADLRPQVLPRKQVRGVHMLVAEQTELRQVSPTEENRNLVLTENFVYRASTPDLGLQKKGEGKVKERE
ncbi:hypothetical protein SLEP1_g50321 [Rubroshorea leprosula]|uniref:Uncharacterized protein n=1 Tax=Rubroshorea leprosula TaxID=152421 RepID=A0AAV5LZQ9_9ROSI|nr:hypothetical protein SLEP1_g50321 [Rubroshorea leprosula]